MNGPSRYARTEVVAQAAAAHTNAARRLDRAVTSGIPANNPGRYQPQRPTTRAGVR